MTVETETLGAAAEAHLERFVDAFEAFARDLTST
jgi:hypothetical protein